MLAPVSLLKFRCLRLAKILHFSKVSEWAVYDCIAIPNDLRKIKFFRRKQFMSLCILYNHISNQDSVTLNIHTSKIWRRKMTINGIKIEMEMMRKALMSELMMFNTQRRESAKKIFMFVPFSMVESGANQRTHAPQHCTNILSLKISVPFVI